MSENLDGFLKSMRREFGNNSIFTTDDWEAEDVDIIPTGSLGLDKALGVGGLPRGRVTELYGRDGAGKTTLSLHILVGAQKQDLNVLYVDVENAVDPNYAKSLGADIDGIYWSQPEYQEEALKIIEGGINSKEFGLIILDSVGALAPKKEQEDELGSANVALTPRALTQFFRRNQYKIRENNVALLLINQIRDNISSFWGGIYTPGGNALKHARSVVLYIRRTGDVKVSGEVIGHEAEVVVKKNKVAVPFKSAKFDIIYGKGIDPYRDVLETAKDLGVVILKGSYYTFEGENIGQGKDNASQTLKDNPELFDKIRRECLDYE